MTRPKSYFFVLSNNLETDFKKSKIVIETYLNTLARPIRGLEYYSENPPQVKQSQGNCGEEGGGITHSHGVDHTPGLKIRSSLLLLLTQKMEIISSYYKHTFSSRLVRLHLLTYLDE